MRTHGAAAAALLVIGGVPVALAPGGARSLVHATSAAATSAGATSAHAAASAACGGAAQVSGTLRLKVGGRERSVLVHLPPRDAGRSPLPLVLNLHGSGSDAAAQEVFSGMDATADKNGFIVAYPEGAIPEGTGFDWNVPGEPLVGGTEPPAGSPDDVSYLVALVRAIAARDCVDPHRVFATGMSGGGRMASQLACDAAATFAAVAPVAGLRFPSPCPDTRPVSIVAFHGSADPVDPYAGNGEAYWTYSVPTAARRWAAHDQSASRPKVTSGAGYTLTRYGGCASGTSVELYTLRGEGHEWPGGPTMPRRLTALLGPQSDAVDADRTMWAFFSAHAAG